MNRRIESEGHNIVRRKSKFWFRLAICGLVLLIVAIGSIPAIRAIKIKETNSISISDVYDEWNKSNYQEVYDMTSGILLKSPFHNAALTLNGYSAFYIAVSQTDTVLAQNYIDEGINRLRLASFSASKDTLPQLMYMLGKSYFYKNTLSSYHYYSDLAIKYLNLALEYGYEADDIPEYLGLSYASLGMTQESINAFTGALLVRESDILLLAIAEQYYKNQQLSSAKAYLHRVSTETKDDTLKFKSQALLGQIYLEEQNYPEAEKMFHLILEINPNYADAYYGLGVVYEQQKDLVKARAEWRKALRLDVNHQNALKKMAEYK